MALPTSKERMIRLDGDRRSLLAHKEITREILMLRAASTRQSAGLQASVMPQRGRRSSAGQRTSGAGLYASSLEKRGSSVTTLTPAQQLVTSEKILMRAVYTMLFCVFANSVGQYCVNPNYPLMTSVGAHPESFPNTDPFDLATAQYFIKSSCATASFFSNLVVGWLSDRYGRRPTPWGEYAPDGCADRLIPVIPLEEYIYLKTLAEHQLFLLRDAPEHKELLVASLNGLHSDEEETDQAKYEMGEWFSNYLLETGYHPREHAPLLKHAISKSFPRLSDKIVDAETMESRLLNIIKWLNDMIQRDGLDDKPWWYNLFSKEQSKSHVA